MEKTRNYCFTWNNPSEDAPITIRDIGARYCIYQLEEGEAGTPHLQGLLIFKSQKSFSSVKLLLPLCHLEQCRNVAASIKYCSKEEGRLEPPVEIGERPNQGRRSDLETIANDIVSGTSIMDVAKNDPAVFVRNFKGLQALSNIFHSKRNWEMDVQVYTGTTGTGKTRKAFEIAPNAFWKEKADWWDGYMGEEDVIIDEFTNDVPIGVLLRWLDRYPLRVPVKGGFVPFVAKRIFITSNIPFEEWYPNARQEHKLALRRRITKITTFALLGQ